LRIHRASSEHRQQRLDDLTCRSCVCMGVRRLGLCCAKKVIPSSIIAASTVRPKKKNKKKNSCTHSTEYEAMASQPRIVFLSAPAFTLAVNNIHNNIPALISGPLQPPQPLPHAPLAPLPSPPWFGHNCHRQQRPHKIVGAPAVMVSSRAPVAQWRVETAHQYVARE